MTTENSRSTALELFSRQPKAFDLVITDMNMPGMSGVDLARKMLLVQVDNPIILSTGFCGERLRKQAETIGSRQMVMKPYELSSLAQAIRQVLDQNRERS